MVTPMKEEDLHSSDSQLSAISSINSGFIYFIIANIVFLESSMSRCSDIKREISLIIL